MLEYGKEINCVHAMFKICMRVVENRMAFLLIKLMISLFFISCSSPLTYFCLRNQQEGFPSSDDRQCRLAFIMFMRSKTYNTNHWQ